MDKRSFLRISAMGAAGILSASQQKKANAANSASSSEILYRTLGKTGIRVPVVSSGIVPQDNLPLVREIFKSGMEHFDSAWEYQNGRNDEVVGKMLKEFGREKYTVTSKILLDIDYEKGEYTQAATYQAFMDQLDVSLKRLGLPYVDILYMHKPPTRKAVFHDAMLKGLQKAKEIGKTRFIGISTHGNQAEIIQAAMDTKMVDVLLVGYNFYQDAQPVQEAIAKAAAQGIGIVGMKALGGYYYDKERTQPVMRSAAMKWVLQDPNVATIVLTIKNFQQFEESIPMLTNIELNQEELDHISAHSKLTSLYCRGCMQCRNNCEKNIPVHEAMRAYMYAYGYRDARKAKKVLSEIKMNPDDCSNCKTCKVQCSMQFNIREKIQDISRVLTIPGDLLA